MALRAAGEVSSACALEERVVSGRSRVLGVSHEDTLDSGTARAGPWVVRRTVIDVIVPAVADEDLTLITFCGGLGARWADRRTSITGQRGARIEAMSLWIRISADTGRPTRLDPAFLDLYADFTGDRKVPASTVIGRGLRTEPSSRRHR